MASSTDARGKRSGKKAARAAKIAAFMYLLAMEALALGILGAALCTGHYSLAISIAGLAIFGALAFTLQDGSENADGEQRGEGEEARTREEPRQGPQRCACRCTHRSCCNPYLNMQYWLPWWISTSHIPYQPAYNPHLNVRHWLPWWANTPHMHGYPHIHSQNLQTGFPKVDEKERKERLAIPGLIFAGSMLLFMLPILLTAFLNRRNLKLENWSSLGSACMFICTMAYAASCYCFGAFHGSEPIFIGLWVASALILCACARQKKWRRLSLMLTGTASLVILANMAVFWMGGHPVSWTLKTFGKQAAKRDL